MKTTNYLWVASVAAAVALAGCRTSHKPQYSSAMGGATVSEQPTTPTQTTAGQVSHNVRLTKTAPNTVGVGEEFSYELSATAQSEVSDVTIVDLVPTGATFISSEPAATADGNKLTWKFPALKRGETKTLHVTAKAETEGQLVHCATVLATPQVCLTTVVGHPQLALQKTGPPAARVGQQVTYDIVVQNIGNTVARGVVVTDTLPEELTTGGDQKELTFQVGDLAPGAKRNISVPLTASKRGKANNGAVAVASNAEKVSAEALVAINQPEVKLHLAAKERDTYINHAVPYELEVVNSGDMTLSGVVLSDTAAAGTHIATAEGATVDGTTATWNVGTLSPGEKKNFAMKIVSKTPGQFIDIANVTTAEGPRDSGQDSTTWRGVTGFTIEVGDDPDPIQIGETTKETIRITNQGAAMDVSELDVTVTVPEHLEVVPGTISEGGALEGNKITWPRISSLAPKASIIRTFIAKGIKSGDARTAVAVTTSTLKEPFQQFEITTVY